jgi:hypothetical protein
MAAFYDSGRSLGLVGACRRKEKRMARLAVVPMELVVAQR